jgi:uncharacterized protein YjiS (DUF1127 family)
MRSSIGHWMDWAAMRPGHLAREFGRWRRERAMVAALGALDDGALKDIGIYRGDIPSLAHQRWRGA